MMEIKDFKRGERVLIRCGVGMTMADVAQVIKSNGLLVVQPTYEERRRITPSRVLRHYDRDGNLLQMAQFAEKKKSSEDAWLENLKK